MKLFELYTSNIILKDFLFDLVSIANNTGIIVINKALLNEVAKIFECIKKHSCSSLMINSTVNYKDLTNL